MKLIIQIPCYNEADTLAIALGALPREVAGFDSVEWLVINDGSTDDTVKIARECGVDHVVEFRHNKGLAKGFMAGIQECLKQGADVIVNTDADNQYEAADIPKLTQPILDGSAEYVIGERPISQTEHFSPTKKLLQRLGSWVVRMASGTDVPDAPSGFRAVSRTCAKQLNVYSDYTYTLETIIQTGQRNIAITSVPIRTNADLRPSRLLSSIPDYIQRSVITIIRIFVVYQPFKFFMSLAAILALTGAALGFRFLYYYIAGEGGGYVQSVVLSGALLGMALQAGLIAFVADLLSVNRKLLEEIRLKLNQD
ncbi:MAG: glycosyltransferase involved in cell wall biosynthesis [Halieaceae bacterium]